MAGFTPASGVWTVDYDEFGNAVWRNQNAQVHHMYNTPGQLPPPPLALPPRGTFVPGTRYPPFPPGPDFTPPTRPPIELPPQNQPPEGIITPGSFGWRPPPFPPTNVTSPVVVPQTPPPTLLSSTKREEEAKHWTEKHNANSGTCYLNTLTKEQQLEKPDCLKKYTTK